MVARIIVVIATIKAQNFWEIPEFGHTAP